MVELPCIETTCGIVFQKITDNGLSESVGNTNTGNKCTAIFGTKEIEGIRKI